MTTKLRGLRWLEFDPTGCAAILSEIANDCLRLRRQTPAASRLVETGTRRWQPIAAAMPRDPPGSTPEQTGDASKFLPRQARARSASGMAQTIGIAAPSHVRDWPMIAACRAMDEFNLDKASPISIPVQRSSAFEVSIPAPTPYRKDRS